MGCCGESASTPDTQYSNRVQPVNPAIISQQPGPHPSAQYQAQPLAEKPPLLIPPGPSPPPPSFQQHNQSLNGSAWHHSHTPSPPPQGPNFYSTLLSPNLGGSQLTPPQATYIPSGPSNSAVFFPPLLHPDPVHVPPNNRSVSPPVSTAVARPYPVMNDPAPSDEGKMSISIDFGEYSHCHWQ